ncbi:MAG: hypothetical protein IJ184_06855 [Alphaproteobacteria bacterium]|nr:hypothetical protein [Alphaproteobacteria bacterium]
MKKFVLISSLLIAFSINVWANETKNSAWEGLWDYQRYAVNPSGVLEITDCQNNLCHFSINTANGAHTCMLEGKLKTSAYKAEYREKIETAEGKYDDIVITFELNPDKNFIEIDANYASRMYCGMQGYFIGKYENQNNPLRYDTGFDCWAKDLTDTQKIICAEEELARADKEMTENYQSEQTNEWYNKREICHNDKRCLWEFYISSIKSAYEKKNNKSVNFYEYMGNLSDDTPYYPTDFSLLYDFFIKNMQNKDFEQWKVAFSQISMDNSKCNQCRYHEYGLPGLYTIAESAFYINKNEIWLAFLHIDNDTNKKHIVIYAMPDREEKDIPAEFDNWLDRLKEHFPDGIKLKYFTDTKNK